MSVLDKNKRDDFFEIVRIMKDYGVDFKGSEEQLYQDSKDYIKHHSNKKAKINLSNNLVNQLEKYWYETNDYSVYDSPYYLGDIWACWCHYTRKGLKDLDNPKNFNGRSIFDLIKQATTIIDLGCGFGLTTAALKERFPWADVYGTNLSNTWQYEIASNYANKYKFKLSDSFKNLGKSDLVFAFEYFEHIEKPIEHLDEIVSSNRPKFLIFANGFNGRAIGHFNTYTHNGKEYDNKTMSRMFLKRLKELNYTKLNTKIWNNRPAVYFAN